MELSLATSLRKLRTALVLSQPSSRIINGTFCFATLLGYRCMAFQVGVSVTATGPVLEILTPTLIYGWPEATSTGASEMQNTPAHQ